MRARLFLTSLILGCLLWASVRADVFLTSQNLNDALKSMGRLRQQATNGTLAERAEASFMMGMEAEALATLMSDEVIAHGNQEQLLLDLALERTKELGVAISYSREKRKFFYDGAAFRDYLTMAPDGPQAAKAGFKVLEGEFYQSSGTDPKAILDAAAKKAQFLKKYPTFELNAEVNLMLAIDYRDLYRHYDEAGDTANRRKYRDLVRTQYRLVSRRYPGTEQGDAATKLLARFEEQLRVR